MEVKTSHLSFKVISIEINNLGNKQLPNTQGKYKTYIKIEKALQFKYISQHFSCFLALYKKKKQDFLEV